MIRSLVLLAILLVAVAYALPPSNAWLTEATSPAVNSLKARFVPARIEAMADELAQQVAFGEEMPLGRTWEAWLQREAPNTAEDPWGNLYYLRPERDGFIIGSMGPDGVENSDDDIWIRRNPLAGPPRLGR